MKYTAILKLKEMLERENIPFEFEGDFFGTGEPAYSLRVFRNNKQLCDVIQHRGSYGNESDLLEIMGGLTIEEQEHDSVLGSLTVEEVFMRFRYCYEHNTSTYSTELPEVETGDIIRIYDDNCYQVKDIINGDCVVIEFASIPVQIREIVSVYRFNGKDFKLVWKKEQ